MSFPSLLLVAPAVACLLSWLGAGGILPGRLLTGEGLLDLLTRIAVGSVLVSLGLFGLGRLGAFEHWVVVGVTLALAFPGALLAGRMLRGTTLPRLDPLEWVLVGLVVAALALDLVAATAPPTSPDALTYHLGLPRQWLETGSIGDAFWRFESFNPLGMQVLFAQGLALGGGGAAGAVGAIIALLAAVAVFGLARELGGDRVAALIALALFSLQGMLTWLATSSFAEPGLAFYSTLAVWHAVRYVRTDETASLIGAGLASGAAAGTKYLGLVPAALVLCPLAVVALRTRRGRPLLGAVALAGLVALPWYLRNLVVAHNPVYPVAFGGKYVTSQTHVSEGLGATSISHPVLRLPILPLDLYLNHTAYAKGRYIGTAIFLAAPLALLGAGARLRAVVFAGAVVFVAVCLGTVPSQARFLLPALAVLAALGGVGLARLLRAWPWTRLAVAAALGVVAVAWIVPSAALTRQLLPVAFGVESRDHFVERLTGTRDLLDSVDRRATGTVAFADYTSIFNYPGRAIALDPPEFERTLSRGAFTERLHDHDVADVLTPELDLEQPTSLPEGRVQHLNNLAQVLAPIDRCLRHLAVYDVDVVTSRSTGATEPTRFGLLSVRRC